MTETEELQTMAQHRRRIDPDIFVRIAAPAGLLFSLGFLVVHRLYQATWPVSWPLPVLASLLYAAATIAAFAKRHGQLASTILILAMDLMFCAGLVVRELQFFALILSPLTPLFTTLLLGYRRGFRWLAAFLVVGLFSGLSPLWHPALPAGLSPGVSSFNLAVWLGLLNLAGFAVLYQKYLEDSDTLIDRQLAAITKLSRTDPLTQIANRRAFLDAFSAELNRCQRIRWRFDNQPGQPEPQYRTAQPHGTPRGTPHGQAAEQLGYLSLIMFDLDHFKAINDRHGHCIGDAVLRSTGEMLRSGGLIRDSDCAARYGGEEFVILEPDTNAQGALRSAERIRSHMEQQTFRDDCGQTFQVTISCGVATCLPGQCSLEELINQADQALYQAKSAGRNCTVVSPGVPS